MWKEHKEISKLVINESTVLFIIVLGTFLQFIANIQLARILEPRIFGDFILALQILNFLRPLNQIGLLYSITYYVPGYIAKESFGYLRGFLKWMWKRFFILSAIIISFSIVIGIGAAYFFLNHSGIEQYNFLAFYLIWLIPLRTLVSFQKNLLDANCNYIWATLPTQVISYLVLNVFLLLIAHTTHNNSIYWVIGAYTAVVFITIFMQHQALHRNLYKKFKAYEPLYSIKEWTEKGERMFLMGAIFSAINMVDMLMLKFLGNNSAELGALAVIFSILLTVVVLNQAVKIIINPLISALIKKDNYSKLQRTLHVTNFYKVIYLTIITYILVRYGKSILELFGDGYSEYYPELMVALIGANFYALFDFSSFLLIYGDCEIIANKIVFFQLVTVLILDFILIPMYQLSGAIWGNLISIVLTCCTTLFYARKNFPVKTLFII